MRIAAAADLHYNRTSKGALKDLFSMASQEADVLLLCGDLTDYGLPEETALLADDLHAHVRIPVLGVLGNHDFESGHPEEVRRMMEEAGVVMLNGTSHVIGDVGFAGTDGFGGGFGDRMLSAWGEPEIKQFVQAAVEQALKLEQALSALETERKVVVLHYAPISDTVVGEPPEIFPFLGSGRLEAPINQYHASVVFHGHAHRGSPEGRTSTGIPVYNVSIPLLRHAFPDRLPLRLFDLG